ncbi:hypothetical protein HY450_00770 [Candidatus Pacearchaeota archaeon]|nr:hypothetical protein [Candidatus Pacearchaeota archaeon]
MNKNRKMAVFFIMLISVIGIVVSVSANVNKVNKASINEILEKINFLNDKDKTEISNDLARAGINLDEKYSYDEVLKITRTLAEEDSNYEADWKQIETLLKNEGPEVEAFILRTENQNDEDICSGASSSWDTNQYDNCANTCTTQGDCLECCGETYPEGGGNGQDQERQWCSRYC